VSLSDKLTFLLLFPLSPTSPSSPSHTLTLHYPLSIILTSSANECISEHGRNLCSSLGGTCHTERDGFYLVSLMCVAIGATLLVGYIVPTARRLQSLPAGAWKVSIPQ
jgi:PAT family acetyl-CoA transporter-like MFS transporter 1